MIFITLFFHIVLPMIFLLWIWKNRGDNKISRIAVVLIVGSFLFTMWIAGAGWSIFGNYWPLLFIILYLFVSVKLYWRSENIPWLPSKNFKSISKTSCAILFALLLISSFPEMIFYRIYEDKALELLFPMKDGVYHIVNGGNGLGVNHHYEVNAQRYALDIVKINNWDIRAKGLLPEDLSDYEIFGEEVIAPCSGRIIAVENSLPDLTPPDTDAENLLGNHIVLFCKEHSVLLAHLQKGTVLVKSGDEVEEGAPLGKIGNSGNTSEPHLHMHAVKGEFFKKEDIAWEQEGVPMLFNGRFLIRNDRFKLHK